MLLIAPDRYRVEVEAGTPSHAGGVEKPNNEDHSR